MLNLRTQNLFKRSYSDGTPMVVIGDSELKELQHIIEGVAADVISVFEKYGLDYCLYAGSALGAIRHHGFIPWDDDLDLAMPRNDLERFLDVFDSELGDKYWISTPGRTPGCRAPMTKVLLKGTVLRDRNTYHTDECGVWVDIYPYENVPDGRIAKKVFKVRCLGASLFASCRWFFEDRDMYRAIVGSDVAALKVINAKVRIGRLLAFRSLDFWVAHAYRVFARHQRDDTRQIVVCARWNETLTDRKNVFPAKEADFNGHSWRIPQDGDMAMRMFFGDDYMTPPSPEQLDCHSFFEVDFAAAEH